MEAGKEAGQKKEGRRLGAIEGERDERGRVGKGKRERQGGKERGREVSGERDWGWKGAGVDLERERGKEIGRDWER